MRLVQFWQGGDRTGKWFGGLLTTLCSTAEIWIEAHRHLLVEDGKEPMVPLYGAALIEIGKKLYG